MNDEQRRKIENHLRVIHLAVTQLVELLPEEQSHAGSELQRIDSLKNALYHKYVQNNQAIENVERYLASYNDNGANINMHTPSPKQIAIEDLQVEIRSLVWARCGVVWMNEDESEYGFKAIPKSILASPVSDVPKGCRLVCTVEATEDEYYQINGWIITDY